MADGEMQPPVPADQPPLPTEAAAAEAPAAPPPPLPAQQEAAPPLPDQQQPGGEGGAAPPQPPQPGEEEEEEDPLIVAQREQEAAVKAKAAAPEIPPYDEEALKVGALLSRVAGNRVKDCRSICRLIRMAACMPGCWRRRLSTLLPHEHAGCSCLVCRWQAPCAS